MPNRTTDEARARALRYVAACEEPKALEQMIENARGHGEAEVERAARMRLYRLLPAAEPGTLEHDVWQSIHALEDSLKSEHGRTTLLARTRQKIARDGEEKTVIDLVTGKPSDGFQMLLDRAMPELTFEAVALRHPDRFDAVVREAAEKRLKAAGLDPRALV